MVNKGSLSYNKRLGSIYCESNHLDEDPVEQRHDALGDGGDDRHGDDGMSEV